MPLAKSKNAVGLGNSLMNDRFGKGKGTDRKKVSAQASSVVRVNHATGESYVTNAAKEADWVKLRSITEQNAMDPRLREVLEALEDDAYVDEKDDEDVFGELVVDGKNNGELAIDEFEADLDEDDGWESDATEKAPHQPADIPVLSGGNAELRNRDISESELSDAEMAATAVAEDGDWLRDFAKYKRDTAKRAPPPQAASIIAASAVL